MIIHIWLHWFWITTLAYKGLLLVFCSSPVAEAGVVDAGISLRGEEYAAARNASQRTRRTSEVVEEGEGETEGDVEEGATTIASDVGVGVGDGGGNVTETFSNEAADGSAYHGSMSSDVEDTYGVGGGGGVADGFHYPLKKYSKSKYGKLKAKDKDGVGRTEATPGDSSSLESNATTTTTENETVEATNRTAGERNETAAVAAADAEEERTATNATEEQASAETVANETSLMAENKLEESSVRTTVEPFVFDNRVAAATSSESRERLSQPGLDAGSITGITFGIVVLSGFIGALSFVMYRRRYLNKPQALNDKCSNLDSSGYIDDTSLRENSEEMYSLDNDSFLNSLEAMTIQNYWTENVKHTKL